MSRYSKNAETGLTAQQEKFCQAVARGESQTAAYREAYPLSRRWPDQSVRSKASNLAKEPAVAARIRILQAKTVEKATEKLTDKFAITKVRTLSEIARIAYSDVGNLFDERGQLRDIHELTAAERACIASFEVEVVRRPDGAGGTWDVEILKVKLWNKVEALEKLAKHLGLYEADNKQKAGSLFDGLPREVVLEVLQFLEDLIKRRDDAESELPAAGGITAHAGTPRLNS